MKRISRPSIVNARNTISGVLTLVHEIRSFHIFLLQLQLMVAPFSNSSFSSPRNAFLVFFRAVMVSLRRI